VSSNEILTQSHRAFRSRILGKDKLTMFGKRTSATRRIRSAVWRCRAFVRMGYLSLEVDDDGLGFGLQLRPLLLPKAQPLAVIPWMLNQAHTN
jgi:hypothetical protein